MTIRRPTKIHFSELPTTPPGIERKEWETYRREVGRLIAEGHEGKHILIKDQAIIGIYDSDAEALTEGYRRFEGEGFLVHQIQTWERVLYCPHFFRHYPVKPLPSSPTDGSSMAVRPTQPVRFYRIVENGSPPAENNTEE
jgi:hypothetical protein